MNHIFKVTEKSDLIEVLELQKITFREIAKQIGTYNLWPLQQTITQIVAELEKGVILKYTNDENIIIGSVRAYSDNNQICHVGKLIVHPDFQNRGIGKALMYEIEKHFSQCLKFTLFTSKDTPNTSYIYNQIGYKIINNKNTDGVDMIIMEKLNVILTTE